MNTPPKSSDYSESPPDDETFLNLLGTALAYTVTVDGPATPQAIYMGGKLLSDVSDGVIGSPAFYEVCKLVYAKRSSGSGVIHTIMGLAEVLTEHEKLRILYCCVLLSIYAVAEHRREFVTAQIAGVFQITPSYYQQIVYSVVADLDRQSQNNEAPAGSGANRQEDTRPPASSTEGKSSKRAGHAWLLRISIMVVIALIFVADYLYDRNIYMTGLDAHQQADCVTALDLFERLIASRLFEFDGAPNFGNYSKEARYYSEQCRTLAQAESERRDGNVQAAAELYLQTTQEELPEFIKSKAIERLGTLIHTSRPEALASPKTCLATAQMIDAGLNNEENDALPIFRFTCGRIFEEQNQVSVAFETYVSVLGEFPGSSVAEQIEDILLSSIVACARSDALLEYDSIKERTDFIGVFYTGCGQRYEAAQNHENAMRLYQEFIDNFHSHGSISDIRAGFARSAFELAKQQSAPTIPTPKRTGTASGGRALVIIQNDSPESMEISFDGPEFRYEELDACRDCIVFQNPGPKECPNKGPSVTYSLMPGEYKILVRARSDNSVQPYIGEWMLESGSEYSSCFYIVITSRRSSRN